MPTASDQLLETFAKNGIRLWLVGDQLHYCARQGALTPDLREMLTRKRDAVVSALLKSEVPSVDVALPPSIPRDFVPLTLQQKRVWRLERIFGFPFFNRYALELRGPLDVVAITRALESVALRHEALRTTVSRTAEGLQQRFSSGFRVNLDWTRFSGSVILPRDMEATRASVESFFSTGLDIEVEPPLKTTLVPLTDSHHVLCIALHDLAVDGVSVTIFFQEFWRLYACHAYGGSAELPRLPIKYADYAVSQGRTYPAWVSQHQQYWDQKLRTATVLRFPSVHEMKPLHRHHAAEVRFSESTSGALKRLARQERTTTSMVILAAFALASAQICGQRDFIVSFPVTGRDFYGNENLIGRFAYCLYLRIDIGATASFIETLKCVTREYLASWEHRDNGAMSNERPELAKTQFEYLPWSPSRVVSAPTPSATSTFKLEVAEFPFKFQPVNTTDSSQTTPFEMDIALRFYEEANEIRGEIVTAPLVAPDVVLQLSRDIHLLCDRAASTDAVALRGATVFDARTFESL